MVILEQWDDPDDKGVILGFDTKQREAFLEFHGCKTPTNVDALSLQFKVPDINEFLSNLSSTETYEGPKKRPWGARYVYMHDPAGISVIVFDGPTY